MKYCKFKGFYPLIYRTENLFIITLYYHNIKTIYFNVYSYKIHTMNLNISTNFPLREFQKLKTNTQIFYTQIHNLI